MINQNDINMMKNDVMDILKSWGTTATIYIPKPESQQTHWNPIMREYTGNVDYDILYNVPVERLEVVNEYHEKVDIIKAGQRYESGVQYKFPAMFDGEPLVITPDMIFTFGESEDRYHIDTIRERIGETIVEVSKFVGGTDSGY